MEKKKQSKTPAAVRSYNAQDSAFVTTTARELALAYPDELNEIIERIQEWTKHPQSEPGLTPLEVILRKFEEETRAIIKKQGSIKADVTALNARQVLLSAKLLREAIKTNHAEQAALEMLKLFSAAVCADLHDTIITGARTVKGRSDGSKQSKKRKAINTALHFLIKLRPAYTATQLWEYFQKPQWKENPHIGKFTIFYDEADGRLHQLEGENRKTDKSIAFRTFREYHHDIISGE